MGAWGAGNFENDDALDWVGDLVDSDDIGLLSRALEAVTRLGEAYLEAPDACTALAAAEVVAALSGGPSTDVPENLRDWLQEPRTQASREIVTLAQRAVTRVRNSSELRDLWQEADSLAEWQAHVDALLDRLAV